MKISHLIFFSILFILVLFSFTTYINFEQSEEVKRNTEYLSQSSMIIRQSNRFQRNILYMERVLKGYLLTGEHDFIQSYDAAVLDNNALLKELSLLIPDTSVQQNYLNHIQHLYDQWVHDYADPLRKVKSRAALSDSNARAFKNLFQEELIVREEEIINKKLQAEFTRLNSQEYTNRENRKTILESSERRTKHISFFLTALSVIVGLLIAVFLTYYISARINKMVNMANSIAQGNYSVFIKDAQNDELTKLTESLNHMAAALDDNISLLKRNNDELDKFAHIVSHDLKAPLRGIANVVSWIEEDHYEELSPRVQEYLGLIKGRLTRSENLIQGILSYTRVNKGVQNKERTDLNQLLNEVLENIPVKPGVVISVQENFPVIYSERIPLLQIFTNLVSNAVKHHDKPEGRVKIYYKDKEDRYEFFVEDDGPGIAKSYHDKIFVIFQTLQERDSFESTGVGLAIVKKILDDRKESVIVVSEPGRGSVFSFTWSK